VVPNLLISALLAILISLVFLIWTVFCVPRRHGGQVYLSLSVLLFLVGGGFGPPLLGIVLGLTAARLHVPLAWWRSRLSAGPRRSLTGL
jgi:hypothetical protein